MTLTFLNTYAFLTSMKTPYSGSTDGEIKDYLIASRQSGIICPSFVGYEPFRQLVDKGFFQPNVGVVKLVFNPEIKGEYYLIIDVNTLEEITLNGLPELHDAREVLAKTGVDYWEAGNLDPKVFTKE